MILPNEDRVGSGVVFELKGDQVLRTKMGVTTILATLTGEKKDNLEFADEQATTKRQKIITCLNENHVTHKTESIKGQKSDAPKKNVPPYPQPKTAAERALASKQGDTWAPRFLWWKEYYPVTWKNRYGIMGVFDVELPLKDEHGIVQRDEKTGEIKTEILRDQLCARRVVEGYTIRPPEGHEAWYTLPQEEVD